MGENERRYYEIQRKLDFYSTLAVVVTVALAVVIIGGLVVAAVTGVTQAPYYPELAGTVRFCDYSHIPQSDGLGRVWWIMTHDTSKCASW